MKMDVVDKWCIGMSGNQRARVISGLKAAENGSSWGLVIRGQHIVCKTCGGNCGQCGDTDILGCDTPASIDSLVAAISEPKSWWKIWR